MDNLTVLTRALAGSAEKSRLISNNIANISTPGYKRQDLNFKSRLKKEISTSDQKNLTVSNKKHIPFSKKYFSFQQQENNRNFRNDGNSVDIDVEMAEMAKNNIYYNVIANRVSGHFSIINQVIQQGGK